MVWCLHHIVWLARFPALFISSVSYICNEPCDGAVSGYDVEHMLSAVTDFSGVHLAVACSHLSIANVYMAAWSVAVGCGDGWGDG